MKQPDAGTRAEMARLQDMAPFFVGWLRENHEDLLDDFHNAQAEALPGIQQKAVLLKDIIEEIEKSPDLLRNTSLSDMRP